MNATSPSRARSPAAHCARESDDVDASMHQRQRASARANASTCDDRARGRDAVVVVARAPGEFSRALFDRSRAKTGDRSSDRMECVNETVKTMTIETKYYVKRDVAMVTRRVSRRADDDDDDDDALDALDDFKGKERNGERARVIIAYVSDGDEIEDVVDDVRRGGEGNDDDGAMKIIARASRRMSDGARMENVHERAFALDEGYEYVEVDVHDDVNDAGLFEELGEGMERVKRAMETATWSDIELKPLGLESDLGREMVRNGARGMELALELESTSGASANDGRRRANDAREFDGFDGSDDDDEDDIEARIEALYEGRSANASEDERLARLEKLAELLMLSDDL